MFKKLARLQTEIKNGDLTIEKAREQLTSFDFILYYTFAVFLILCGIVTSIMAYQAIIGDGSISILMLAAQPIFLGIGIMLLRSKNAGLDSYKVRGFQTKGLLATGVIGTVFYLVLIPLTGVVTIMLIPWPVLAVVAYIVGKSRKLW